MSPSPLPPWSPLLKTAYKEARARADQNAGVLHAAQAAREKASASLDKWRSQLKALDGTVRATRGEIERHKGSKKELEYDVSA